MVANKIGRRVDRDWRLAAHNIEEGGDWPPIKLGRVEIGSTLNRGGWRLVARKIGEI